MSGRDAQELGREYAELLDEWVMGRGWFDLDGDPITRLCDLLVEQGRLQHVGMRRPDTARQVSSERKRVGAAKRWQTSYERRKAQRVVDRDGHLVSPVGPHGDVKTYRYRICRCPPCTQAMSGYHRERGA